MRLCGAHGVYAFLSGLGWQPGAAIVGAREVLTALPTRQEVLTGSSELSVGEWVLSGGCG